MNAQDHASHQFVQVRVQELVQVVRDAAVRADWDALDGVQVLALVNLVEIIVQVVLAHVQVKLVLQVVQVVLVHVLVEHALPDAQAVRILVQEPAQVKFVQPAAQVHVLEDAPLHVLIIVLMVVKVSAQVVRINVLEVVDQVVQDVLDHVRINAVDAVVPVTVLAPLRVVAIVVPHATMTAV